MSGHIDQGSNETLTRALELTEEALGKITRIAIEQIREGVETSNHVEAAERDMRTALRQLVLAERELLARSTLRATVDQHTRVGPDDRSDATFDAERTTETYADRVAQCPAQPSKKQTIQSRTSAR